jgi:hypothetical protein
MGTRRRIVRALVDAEHLRRIVRALKYRPVLIRAKPRRHEIELGVRRQTRLEPIHVRVEAVARRTGVGKHLGDLDLSGCHPRGLRRLDQEIILTLGPVGIGVRAITQSEAKQRRPDITHHSHALFSLAR